MFWYIFSNTLWNQLRYLHAKLEIFNPVSLTLLVVQAPLGDSP